MFSDIKFIFFDLDDSLIDTKGSLLKGIRRACEIIAPKIGISVDDAYNVFVNDVLPNVSAIIRSEPFDAFAYQLGIREKQIIDEGFSFFQEEMDNIKPFDDTIPVLSLLKSEDYVMSLISNGFPTVQFRKVWRAGLAQFFEERIYLPQSISPPYYKPTKRLFTFAMEQISARCEESLMVGDRDLDIIGANLAGMKTCALIRYDDGCFKTEENLKARVPDIVIENLWELLELFNIKKNI
ncbi:MAG: HAD family hydrolase [bacterium]